MGLTETLPRNSLSNHHPNASGFGMRAQPKFQNWNSPGLNAGLVLAPARGAKTRWEPRNDSGGSHQFAAAAAQGRLRLLLALSAQRSRNHPVAIRSRHEDRVGIHHVRRKLDRSRRIRVDLRLQRIAV